jgi:putative ABC transport system permease protein
VRHDFLIAARLLRRRPGFVAGAVGTLALAAGATIAVFSLVYGLLLRPSIVPAADRVVIVRSIDRQLPEAPGDVDYPQLEDWVTSVPALRTLAAVSDLRFDITGGAAAERVDGQVVSWNFFETLGVPPAHGRTFDAGDAGTRPCVISDRLWRGRFGADAHIVGKTITAGDAAFTVLGVMPAGFERWRGAFDLWVPIDTVPDRRPARRGYMVFEGVGRLRPDASAAAAAAQATASIRRVEADPTDRYGASVVPLREDLVTPASRGLLALFVVSVALVWIIACANVGGLFFARTLDRLPELAVRAALGATGRRLVRQLVCESLLVAGAAAALGWIVAAWMLKATIAAGVVLTARSDLVRLDVHSAGAAAVVAIFTAAAIALLPVVAVFRRQATLLVDAGGRGTPTRGRGRLHDVLVGVEVALAVAVLIAAGLVVRSLVNLRHVVLGFEAGSVLSMGISLPSNYDEAGRMQAGDDLVAALRAVPGVVDAALTWDLPVPNAGGRTSLTLDDGRVFRNGEARDRPMTPGKHIVSPGFFHTLGIAIVRGRGFSDRDRAGGEAVAIVSEEMARLHWPGRDPIGHRVSNAASRRNGTRSLDTPWLTIVGVAADVRYGGPAVALKPEMYVPFAQSANPNLFLVLKTAGDPIAVATEAKRRIASQDVNIPVFGVETLGTRLDGVIADARARSAVIGAFAFVALLLTATGIHASMSGRVTARRRELAVRLALGADADRLVRLVLAHAIVIILPAASVGVALALACARLMAAHVFGLSAADPVTYAGGAAGLTALGVLAAYLPARRAARVDPMIALRAE